MFKLNSKLTMACSAAVLALAMTACSSSSDDNPPVASNVPEVVEPEVVEPEVVESEPTPAEQLAAANTAFMAAQGLVDALTSTSTAEEAAAAYAALAEAQAALHAATNLPANQIAALQARIDQLVMDLEEDQAALDAEQLAAAEAALTVAQGLVAALTSAPPTPEEVAAAHTALGAAQAALHAATNLPEDQVATLQGQIDQLTLDLAAVPSVEAVALGQAQADAATAATAAMEAATAAKVASDAAQTARENRATLQTGGKSGDLAHAAYMQAKAAADAAEEAQTASDAAAEATNSVETTRLLVMAEAARDNAVIAQGMAETQSEAAVTAAGNELSIVGTVKTVGGTSIDAAADRSVVTTGEDTTQQVEDTGLQHKVDFPMGTGDESDGDAGTAGMPDADLVVKFVAPVAGAAERPFAIGKLVDSADDMARLMIVTQYAGSKTVKVFASDGGADTDRMSSRPNTIQLRDDVFANLKLVGTYYAANGTNTLEPANDMVAAGAEGKQVYSYVDDANSADDATDDITRYVVHHSTNTVTEGDVSTYNYSDVTIHVILDRDGDPATLDDDVEVTAKIGEATDYNHIHFGVWAALMAAKASGVNDIADLGIGFVQSIGDGLTGADMPNNGDATYSGNWAAAVRAADDDGNGAIVLDSGAASLKADFDMDEITATLTGLATLSGDISGNTFKGDTAEDITHGSLDSGGKFTGEFSGGFYGTKAAEAGGIFDFTSEDAEDGAFRGSFGGDRVPE